MDFICKRISHHFNARNLKHSVSLMPHFYKKDQVVL